MLKIQWNAVKICLFGQSTEQPLTLSAENLEKTSNFDGWGLTLVTYRKKCIGDISKVIVIKSKVWP